MKSMCALLVSLVLTALPLRAQVAPGFSDALEFVRDDRTMVTIDPHHSLPLEDLTVSLLVRNDPPTASGQDHTLIARGKHRGGPTGETAWTLFLRDGQLWLTWDRASYASGIFLQPRNWYHVVATRKFLAAEVEVGFHVVGADTPGGSPRRRSFLAPPRGNGSPRPAASNQYVTIGGIHLYDSTPPYAERTGRHFDGLIDDVRLWNRALGAGEIDQLLESGREAGRSAPLANLVGRWRLTEGQREFTPTFVENDLGHAPHARLGGVPPFQTAPTLPTYVSGLPEPYGPLAALPFYCFLDDGSERLKCSGLGQPGAFGSLDIRGEILRHANADPLTPTQLTRNDIRIDAVSNGLDIIETDTGELDMNDSQWASRWVGAVYAIEPFSIASSAGSDEQQAQAAELIGPNGVRGDVFADVLPGSGGIHRDYRGGDLFTPRTFQVYDAAAANASSTGIAAIDLHLPLLRMGPTVNDGTLQCRVYFSVSATTATKLPSSWFGGTRSGASVLLMDCIAPNGFGVSGWDLPRLYCSYADLGLCDSDEIDALAVDARSPGHRVVFSLTRDSTSTSTRCVPNRPPVTSQLLFSNCRGDHSPFEITFGAAEATRSTGDYMRVEESTIADTRVTTNVIALCLVDPTYVASMQDLRLIDGFRHPLGRTMTWPVELGSVDPIPPFGAAAVSQLLPEELYAHTSLDCDGRTAQLVLSLGSPSLAGAMLAIGLKERTPPPLVPGFAILDFPLEVRLVGALVGGTTAEPSGLTTTDINLLKSVTDIGDVHLVWFGFDQEARFVRSPFHFLNWRAR